jgi:hypothetical protein
MAQFVIFTKYYRGDQVEEDEMGERGHVGRRMRNVYKI